MDSIYDLMTVDLPDGEKDGMRVQKFEITANPVRDFRLAAQGRAARPGTYTKLTCGGTFWMSDTPAEKKDHAEAVMRASKPDVRRVLINGLGIGMVLKAVLSFEHIEHVDVVERDPRVVALVGPTYLKDDRVTIHTADAYAQSACWPSGTRWDIGWSDIWPDLDTDDLKDHARLNRSYGRRCGWHGCWAHDLLVYRRDCDRRSGW
jgi:hypothetical protein